MAKQFNAKWADQVMMCFPRFIRYPNIKDERIMADAEKMNANPASQALRDRVVAEVRGKLEAAISTDAQSKQALQKVLSSPDVSTELQVKKIEVDPSGLPFPSMMSCVVMDPVKNNEFFDDELTLRMSRGGGGGASVKRLVAWKTGGRPSS